LGNFFELFRKQLKSEKNIAENKKGHYEKKIIHLIREFHSIENCYRKIIFSHHKPVNEKSIQEFQEIKEQGLFEIEKFWSEISKGRKTISRDLAKSLVAFAKHMENWFTKTTFPSSDTGNIRALPETKGSEKDLAKKFLEEIEQYKIRIPRSIRNSLRELSK